MCATRTHEASALTQPPRDIPHQPSFWEGVRRCSLALIGMSVAGIGVAVLKSWTTEDPTLLEQVTGLPTLRFVSATTFVLIGLAFILLGWRKHWTAGLIGLPVIILPVAVLLHRVFGVELEDLDRQLTAIGVRVDLVPSASVSWGTAAALAAIGLALLLSPSVKQSARALLVSSLGALALGPAIVALVGYLTGVQPLFGWIGFYGMSAPISLAIVLSGLGLQAVAIGERPSLHSLSEQPWLVAPIFVATIVASMCLALAQAANTRLVTHKHIEGHALALQVGLTEKISSDLMSLQRLEKRWPGPSQNDQQAWERDASLIVEQHFGIGSVAWIDADQVARWVVPAGVSRLAKDRFVGIDASRRNTMEEARRTHQTRLTPAVDLFSGGPGVVIFVPILRNGHFYGFIGAAYNTTELFDPIADRALAKDFSVAAYDGDRTLFKQLADQADSDQEWGVDQQLVLPGTTWRLRIWPSADFLAGETNALPLQILLGGTLLGLLFAALAWFAQKALNQKLTIEATLAQLEHNNHELSQARQQAEAANVTKSLFLANVSHELRTPLGVIIGYCDILTATPGLDETQATYIDSIDRNSRSLLALVNDILDLTKVESGNLSIEKTKVCLPEVLAEVLSGLRLNAAERGLTLTGRVENSVPATVYTDRLRLRQILLNLIGNAIKFTAKGTVTVQVRLVPQVKGALIEMAVTDTGCGIAAEQQHLLFTPFTQANPSVARQYGGTGLGLSLSRRLARALGGDVYLATSAPGQGSTFIATIDPGHIDAAAMLRPEQVDLMPRRTGQKQTTLTFASMLTGISILAVDDNADQRTLISTVLRTLGATVETAEGGQQGIDQALRGAFDLVLMDAQMPGIDGYAAVKELQAKGYRQPIIAMTGNATQGERERCIASGFCDYLCKPVSPTTLATTILRHAKSRDQASGRHVSNHGAPSSSKDTLKPSPSSSIL